MDILKGRDFSPWVQYRFSRSSGAGGQSVNKVSSRVELIFFPSDCDLLSADEKQLISERLASRIRNDGAIHLVSQVDRTQLGNKKRVYERLVLMLEKALTPAKKRIPTSVSQPEKEKRLSEKKKVKKVKEQRKKINFGDE